MMEDDHRAAAEPRGPTEAPREPSTELVQVLPGLARVAVGAGLRTALWGIETSLKVVRGAMSVEEAARALQQFGSGLRSYARELLGIQDLDNRVRQLMPGPASRMRAAARREPVNGRSLREQGADLLRQSADVGAEDGVHPAYARILSELAVSLNLRIRETVAAARDCAFDNSRSCSERKIRAERAVAFNQRARAIR